MRSRPRSPPIFYVAAPLALLKPTIARVRSWRRSRATRARPVLTFRNRVREAARALPGAMRVKLGGIAREPSAGFTDLFEGIPRGAVTLSDIPPHPSQLEALAIIRDNKRVVLTCGRRWGKTVLLATIAVDAVLAGQSVGLFCPTFKFLGPLVEVIVPASSP